MRHRHLQAFHALVSGNRDLVSLAGNAVCTSCGQHFGFDVEAEVIDDSSVLAEPESFTVICPHCGVDAVLPELTPQILAALADHWHR
jgi:hypothetical protein